MKCNDCDTEVNVPAGEQPLDGVLCYDCGVRQAWDEHGELDF